MGRSAPEVINVAAAVAGGELSKGSTGLYGSGSRQLRLQYRLVTLCPATGYGGEALAVQPRSPSLHERTYPGSGYTVQTMATVKRSFGVCKGPRLVSFRRRRRWSY